MRIARKYFETEDGKRELFKNRDAELIVEIFDFAKKIKTTEKWKLKSVN